MAMPMDVDRISDAEHIHIHCYCYHYSFWFSCGYLAHTHRHISEATDEDGKNEKSVSNHERAVFCSLLLRPFHWPCPISMTHEYIKLILLLARNSTWNWTSWHWPFACFNACIFRSYFAWVLTFPHINRHSHCRCRRRRHRRCIQSSTISLPFLPICNSYTVEFYYEMFVLYRYSVLYFFVLLLLPLLV